MRPNKIDPPYQLLMYFFCSSLRLSIRTFMASRASTATCRSIDSGTLSMSRGRLLWFSRMYRTESSLV